MTVIADHLGCSKGALYHHFVSKAGLLSAVVRHQCETDAAEAFEAPTTEVRDYLVQTLERLTRFLFREQTLAMYRRMALESAQFPELSRGLLSAGILRGEDCIRRFLSGAVADGRMKSGNPSIVAEQLVSLALGDAYLRAIRHVEPAPSMGEIQANIQAAVDLVLTTHGQEANTSANVKGHLPSAEPARTCARHQSRSYFGSE